MRARHAHRPDILGKVDTALARPGLYDKALRLLARMGLPLPDAVLHRAVNQSQTALQVVENAWEIVYRDPAAHWQACKRAEKLMDIEDHFRRWRFNHITAVERIIGVKRGTGGISGVADLRPMDDIQHFPELWSLRTTLKYLRGDALTCPSG
jgi:tryptophan 2,3-dioxygenase